MGCRELGIGIVPYSPLGHGFFAGYKAETTKTRGNEFREMLPRFQGENLAKNEQLRARVEVIAEAKKCTLNQLALAWVHHKGADMVPIPGNENAFTKWYST
jgi:aryl-alcohol dehydrogenase-like predicted oxidoreductase